MFIGDWTTVGFRVHHSKPRSTINEHIGEDICTLNLKFSDQWHSMEGSVECTLYVLSTRKHIYSPNNHSLYTSSTADSPYKRIPSISKPPISHLLYKAHTHNRLRLSLLRHFHTWHCRNYTHSEPNTCSLLQVPVQVVYVYSCH